MNVPEAWSSSLDYRKLWGKVMIINNLVMNYVELAYLRWVNASKHKWGTAPTMKVNQVSIKSENFDILQFIKSPGNSLNYRYN